MDLLAFSNLSSLAFAVLRVS